MSEILSLYANFGNITWQMAVMWLIGGVLIYLGIGKKMEPTLLVPMGFGAILVNLPLSGAITQGAEVGALDLLFQGGIANELMLYLLFIGIGAMCDFTPLAVQPEADALRARGAVRHLLDAIAGTAPWLLHSRTRRPSAIIGAADGPTSIVVAQALKSKYLGAIMVAAYSYMALVPIIQPPVIKLLTTKKERLIRMPYKANEVSKTTKILFPIIITIVAGIIAPKSVSLVGFLMFGNLIRECGVLDSLSDTAQNVWPIWSPCFWASRWPPRCGRTDFLSPQTLMIIALGLVAFIFDTIGGVLFAKLLNLFTPNNRINPMIGAAGISAFPMSARVVNQMAMDEDPTNVILMHAVGANVSGQIASVLAGGIILTLIPRL